VDVGPNPVEGTSYLHKLWSNGSEEWFSIAYSPSPAGGVIRTELDRDEWLLRTAGHEPVPCAEASAWGDGVALRK